MIISAKYKSICTSCRGPVTVGQRHAGSSQIARMIRFALDDDEKAVYLELARQLHAELDAL
jgi:hypothetical protein